MIALIIHQKMEDSNMVGFSLCTVKFNPIKLISKFDKFSRVFHNGSPKAISIENILHVWGKVVFIEALETVYILNNRTVFTNNRKIMQKMFELSMEYKNLY